MKVTIAPDGSIELEVHKGEGQTALDLIRSLQAKPEAALPRPRDKETVTLTQKLRETLDVLLAYPEGCHYSMVAEFLGVSPSVANSRCQELRHRDLVTWLKAGVYAPVAE